MQWAMVLLRDAIRVELGILVVCIVAIIFWKIARSALRRESRVAFRRACGGGVACALRMQVLAGSLLFALFYLASALRSAGGGALPPVPDYALVLLGGSQAVFAGAAAWRRLYLSGNLRNEGEK